TLFPYTTLFRSHFHCLHLAFLAAEARRQRVDDHRHHVQHRQRQRVTDHHGNETHQDGRGHRHPEHAVADQAALDETEHRRDRGEDHDVAGVQALDCRRFRGGHRPLGPGRQQERLCPRDQTCRIHDVFAPGGWEIVGSVTEEGNGDSRTPRTTSSAPITGKPSARGHPILPAPVLTAAAVAIRVPPATLARTSFRSPARAAALRIVAYCRARNERLEERCGIDGRVLSRPTFLY